MRDKLIGGWQQSDGSGPTKAVWTLQNNGDSMHTSNSNGTRTVGEFDCNTWAGHRSKVAMWFNGAKLIQLETTGNQVIKRRSGVPMTVRAWNWKPFPSLRTAQAP